MPIDRVSIKCSGNNPEGDAVEPAQPDAAEVLHKMRILRTASPDIAANLRILIDTRPFIDMLQGIIRYRQKQADTSDR